MQRERHVAARAAPAMAARAARRQNGGPAAPVRRARSPSPRRLHLFERGPRLAGGGHGEARACRAAPRRAARRLVDALRQLEPSHRSQLSGRGVALPQISTAPAAPPAGPPRGARRSAGRPPACTRSRAPRRPRSDPGPAAARRPPSAARRRPAPRRGAGAATRRSARPAELGVQHRDALAEALLEAAGGLRRERDLRHQHDRGAPGSSASSAARR